MLERVHGMPVLFLIHRKSCVTQPKTKGCTMKKAVKDKKEKKSSTSSKSSKSLKSSKKLGFALGAGGARGIAHIGFLQAMEEEGIKPDYLTGCSMGSVIGAAYASGMSLERLHEKAMALRFFDIIKPTKQKGGLFAPQRVREFLLRHIGDIEFSDLKIPFHCVAVDMITQNVVELSEGNVLDAVIASSSIPSVFCPTEKNGMRLVDGGIIERVPCVQLKNMGADVVVGVDVLGAQQGRDNMPDSIRVLLETIDIMSNYITKRKYQDNKAIIDLWIEPQIENMSQFTFRNLHFAYEKGYESGKENVKIIKKLLQN